MATVTKNRNLTKTDKLMSNCFEFFCRKITKKSGSDVVGFIEKGEFVIRHKCCSA
jgi:hypothetical protein